MHPVSELSKDSDMLRCKINPTTLLDKLQSLGDKPVYSVREKEFSWDSKGFNPKCVNTVL